MHAWMAALTETGTGVLMVLGLLTPFAAAGITGIMFVAFWTHRTKWFVFKEGVEYNVVVAVVVAAIATFSAGEWSLDHAIGWIADDLAGWTGMAISVLVGIGVAALQLAVFYRPGPKAAEARLMTDDAVGPGEPELEPFDGGLVAGPGRGRAPRRSGVRSRCRRSPVGPIRASRSPTSW